MAKRYKVGVSTSLPNQNNSLNKMQKQAANYKTRLRAVGSDYDASDDRNALEKFLNLEKDQNVLFDALELINRPQNALLTAWDYAKSGDSFGEGLKEGFLGHEKTSGKDILMNHYGDWNDEEGKINKVDLAGFGLELLTDPLNWALIPLTGGVSKAAEVGADAAQAAAKGAKALNAADNIVDAAQTAKKAYRYSKLDDFLGLSEKGIHLASGNELVGKAIGKGIKSVAGASDNVISAGLKALDKASESKIIKRAAEEGFNNVDDYLKSIGKTMADYAGRDTAYQATKTGFKDAFNQASTALGKLKLSRRNAKGTNELIEQAMRGYSDNLGETAYKYAIDNLSKRELTKYADDITDLRKFIDNGGRAVDWINDSANINKDFANLLKNKQNTIAEDILDVIESGRSTKINNNRALRELIENGTFTGDENSVKQLLDFLNTESANRGLKLDNIGQDLSSIRNANEINSLKGIINDTTKSAAERKAAQDQIEALLRQQGTLTVDNSIIRDMAENPEFRNAFSNLDLNRSWEYNADEWNRIQKLKNNPEFMNLVSQNENAYKDLAARLKEATGIDYSDIVNNPAYARRASNKADNLNEQINVLRDQLNVEGLDDETKEVLQSTINSLEKQVNKSGYGTTKAFSSRAYSQPTVIANRQFQEEKTRLIEKTKSQIENLSNSFSREKTESLVNQINKLMNDSGKVEKLNKRLAKQNLKVENLTTSINNSTERLSNITKTMDDNFIDKAMRIQDQSVTANLTKDLSNIDGLNKKWNQLVKQLDNVDNLSDDAVDALTKDLVKTNKQIEKISAKLNKTVDIIDGNVDDTILRGLDKNAKEMKKFADETLRRDALKSARAQATASLQETQEAINTLNNNVSNKIKNIEHNIGKIDPAKDAEISKQIKSLAAAQSVLESAAGQELFNRNFYAGIDDFINYAEYTNKSAQVFRDALTMGVFNDPNVIKLAGDETIPKGWVSVNGKDLSNRLNDLQNLISDSNPEKIIGSGKNAMSVKDWMKTLEGNTYYMDERVANLFKNISSKSVNNDAKTILNLVDKANTAFKKFSTLTPGFQIRNYLGNSFNMYLSGMPATKIPVYQKKAATLLNNMEDLLGKWSQVGIEGLNDAEKASFNLIQQFYEGGFNDIGTAARDLEKVQEGLELGSKANILNKATNLSMKMNSSADAMNRMALLMYANESPKYLKKLGADNAIQAVKYALMDPRNMSEFEQNVVKKIIPFYTFTKQNLMFQITNMTKNIGRYKNVMRAINNMYNDLDEDSYNAYQKDAMQIPISSPIPLPFLNDDGNQMFLKANLPLSDLGEFLSNPIQRTIASSTPLIKAPVEFTTGKSLFTGEDTNYKTLSKTLQNMGISSTGITNSADAVDLILNNFGFQNVSTNLFKKVQAIIESSNGEISGQQLWAEIFRSILQNTKEENVKMSGLYDELEKYQAEIKRLKNQGIDVPTIKEITASNKIKVNKLKKKRARSN